MKSLDQGHTGGNKARTHFPGGVHVPRRAHSASFKYLNLTRKIKEDFPEETVFMLNMKAE